MPSLSLLVALLAASSAADAKFDLLACATNLVPGDASPVEVRRTAYERGLAPPAMKQFALHRARELEAAAHTITSALPKSWQPHVELDATGMAKLVELRIPGAHRPAELAPAILDFVRSHACLFGVVSPELLAAHATGPEHEGAIVEIDVRPRSVGTIDAEVEVSAGGWTRVHLHHHLWPVADPKLAVDPKLLLARYVGYPMQTTAYHMLRNPRVCVRTHRAAVATESSFRWNAGPMMLCKSEVIEVHSGAFVWLAGGDATGASPLGTLPSVLQLNGRAFDNAGGSWLAPAFRTPGEDSTPQDSRECTPR
jgi:hypothetical protein